MLYEGSELSKGDLVNRTVFFKRAPSGSLVVVSLTAKVGTKCAF